MQCINITHPEYIDLENNSSVHPDALKAMISLWMENNPNEDRYPTLDELGIPQKELFKKVAEIKPGVEELFNENTELANSVYSKILTNSGLSAENLLSLLLKDNLIEKQCP